MCVRGRKLRGCISAQCEEGLPNIAGQRWSGLLCDGALPRKKLDKLVLGIERFTHC